MERAMETAAQQAISTVVALLDDELEKRQDASGDPSTAANLFQRLELLLVEQSVDDLERLAPLREGLMGAVESEAQRGAHGARVELVELLREQRAQLRGVCGETMKVKAEVERRLNAAEVAERELFVPGRIAHLFVGPNGRYEARWIERDADTLRSSKPTCTCSAMPRPRAARPLLVTAEGRRSLAPAISQ